MSTTPTPAADNNADHDSSRLIIVVTVVVVFGIALAVALLFRQPPKPVALPSPYLAKLKLSDFKMSAAENFIGSTVNYFDGTVTNTGDKTITNAIVEVNFEDSLGQVVLRESDLPLLIVRTNGAYDEPVDLSTAPLAPGQSAAYRLTFDSGSISTQWNHQYPDLTITAVTVK